MNIAHVPDLQEFMLKDGSCRNFDRTNKQCRIYDTRPTVCRVDSCRPPLLDPETWHALNFFACDFMHLRLYGVEREQTGNCTHTLREIK